MAADIYLHKLFDKMALDMTVIISGGEYRYFKAFLQPLRYKNKMYLSGIPTELGFDGLQKFLIIAPPDADLKQINNTSVKLFFGDEHLSIDHSELVYLKQEPLYYWAVASKEA